MYIQKKTVKCSLTFFSCWSVEIYQLVLIIKKIELCGVGAQK